MIKTLSVLLIMTAAGSAQARPQDPFSEGWEWHQTLRDQIKKADKDAEAPQAVAACRGCMQGLEFVPSCSAVSIEDLLPAAPPPSDQGCSEECSLPAMKIPFDKIVSRRVSAPACYEIISDAAAVKKLDEGIGGYLARCQSCPAVKLVGLEKFFKQLDAELSSQKLPEANGTIAELKRHQTCAEPASDCDWK